MRTKKTPGPLWAGGLIFGADEFTAGCTCAPQTVVLSRKLRRKHKARTAQVHADDCIHALDAAPGYAVVGKARSDLRRSS